VHKKELLQLQNNVKKQINNNNSSGITLQVAIKPKKNNKRLESLNSEQSYMHV
jgi:hypothetical protein